MTEEAEYKPRNAETMISEFIAAGVDERDIAFGREKLAEPISLGVFIDYLNLQWEMNFAISRAIVTLNDDDQDARSAAISNLLTELDRNAKFLHKIELIVAESLPR